MGQFQRNTAGNAFPSFGPSGQFNPFDNSNNLYIIFNLTILIIKMNQMVSDCFQIS